MARQGVELPPPGEYGVGTLFLPQDKAQGEKAEKMLEEIVKKEGQKFLGWREVPVDDSMIGPTARAVMPSFWHCFVQDPAGTVGIELDRKALADLAVNDIAAFGAIAEKAKAALAAR